MNEWHLLADITGAQIGAAAGIVSAVIGATALFIRTFSDVQTGVAGARADLTDTLSQQVAALRSDIADRVARFERALEEEREHCDEKLDNLEMRLRAELGVK